MFETMVTLCVSALPGEQMMRSPLAPLEVTKERQRLYQRFTRCRHTSEMVALAKQLSAAEYQQLRAAIGTALITASPTDRAGIEQRLHELQGYWGDLQAWPEGDM